MIRVLAWSVPLVLALAAAIVVFLGRPARADILEMRASGEGHAAEVYYANSRMQDSVNLSRTDTHGGVQARVTIEVTGAGPERITVEPLDPDYIAVPWQAEIEDGESVIIQIMRAAGLS